MRYVKKLMIFIFFLFFSCFRFTSSTCLFCHMKTWNYDFPLIGWWFQCSCEWTETLSVLSKTMKMKMWKNIVNKHIKISYVWLVNSMLTHIPIYTYILHSRIHMVQGFNYNVSLYSWTTILMSFKCHNTKLLIELCFAPCSEYFALSTTESFDASRSSFGSFTSYELRWSTSGKLKPF